MSHKHTGECKQSIESSVSHCEKIQIVMDIVGSSAHKVVDSCVAFVDFDQGVATSTPATSSSLWTPQTAGQTKTRGRGRSWHGFMINKHKLACATSFTFRALAYSINIIWFVILASNTLMHAYLPAPFSHLVKTIWRSISQALQPSAILGEKRLLR